MSRRRALAAGAGVAAGAAGLALLGCGEGGGAPGTPAPRSGGTLRFGTSLPMSYGLDPQVERGSGLTIFPRIYGYLHHVDPRDEAVLYDHVASYEQPDELTYVLRLRDDVRFHDRAPVDGRPVTAQDAAASVLRYRDNPLATSKTWHATVLESVEARDDRTLVVRTKHPYVYTLAALGDVSAGAIIPTELIEANADLSANGVGSGPFALESFDAGRVRLRANAAYHRGAPYLDAMEWTIFGSDGERHSAFTARAIDVMPNRDKNEAARVRELSRDVEVAADRSLSYLSLGLRVDRPPFVDPHVREAADIAVDRDALLREIAFGDGDILGPVNPRLAGGFWSLPRAEILEAQGGNDTVNERRSRARALLAAASVDPSFPLQVADVPQLVDVANVVAAHLRDAGFSPQVEALSQLDWFVRFRRREFTATLISHAPYEYPDLPMRLYHSAGAEGAGNAFGFGEAAFDRLLERSWGEAEREVRRETLLEAQRLLIAARPMVQLFTGTGYTSWWSYVRGLGTGLPGSLAQYEYGQWLALPVDGRPG